MNRYTSISQSNTVNIKRELNNIKKNSDSVTQYMHKKKEARDKMVSVGVIIDDEEIIHIVLQGLCDAPKSDKCMCTESHIRHTLGRTGLY